MESITPNMPISGGGSMFCAKCQTASRLKLLPQAKNEEKIIKIWSSNVLALPRPGVTMVFKIRTPGRAGTVLCYEGGELCLRLGEAAVDGSLLLGER